MRTPIWGQLRTINKDVPSMQIHISIHFQTKKPANNKNSKEKNFIAKFQITILTITIIQKENSLRRRRSFSLSRSWSMSTVTTVNWRTEGFEIEIRTILQWNVTGLWISTANISLEGELRKRSFQEMTFECVRNEHANSMIKVNQSYFIFGCVNFNSLFFAASNFS